MKSFLYYKEKDIVEKTTARKMSSHNPVESPVENGFGSSGLENHYWKEFTNRRFPRLSAFESFVFLVPWCFCILGFCILLLVLFLTGCGRSGPPFPPAKALETLKIKKGFRIETFVTEPAIASPVAMEFDEEGRIYVVEMPGYPLDTRPTGRIKLLEDTNGDGRPDRSRIFADGLVLPTGVMRWKKGILVTAAPDVWYFEDTDGDERADVCRKVMTDFPLNNQQHTVNGPLYGLDNWIYLAHEGPARAVIFKEKFGDLGSGIRFAERNGGPVLKVERRGVRFRPDSF